ncbi:MAG: TonB-dependent receptor [Alistipes finegoldii]
MKRYILLLSALFAATLSAVAQRPLYIVNGVETEEIESIPPDDIENIESLPADEETIARYGEKAANGVMLVTLRYDQSAVFTADSTFSGYIARQVKWGDDEPAARIILRYTVTPEGDTVVAQELESTDSRLKRRVLKAVAEAPRWTPARKTARPSRAKASCTSSFPKAS